METEITVQELQEKLLSKRREQGISETGHPTRSTSSALNDRVIRVPESAKNWKPSPRDEADPHPWDRPPVDGCACPACEGIREKERKELENQRLHPEEVLAHWGVPPKFIGASFETFVGGEAMKGKLHEAVAEKRDVLLMGSTGCGKTHLAAAMMRRVVVTSGTLYELARDPVALFLPVPELLMKIRSTFRTGSTETEETLLDRYSTKAPLILDDLGSERSTEWTESTLYLLIDRRSRDMRWTIVTTNLTMKEIENTMGARIASRLADMLVVANQLQDWRKKR